MRSWSKWVIFSRRMKSSIRVGPRRPALSEFWLSATATPMLVVSIWPLESTRARSSDSLPGLWPGTGLPSPTFGDVASSLTVLAASIGSCGSTGLPGMRRVAAIEAVLAGLERVGRHRRAGRLGADLLRRQALLRPGCRADRRRFAPSPWSTAPQKVDSTVPTFSLIGAMRPEGEEFLRLRVAMEGPDEKVGGRKRCRAMDIPACRARQRKSAPKGASSAAVPLTCRRGPSRRGWRARRCR